MIVHYLAFTNRVARGPLVEEVQAMSRGHVERGRGRGRGPICGGFNSPLASLVVANNVHRGLIILDGTCTEIHTMARFRFGEIFVPAVP